MYSALHLVFVLNPTRRGSGLMPQLEARLCSTAFPLERAVFTRSADTTAAWLVCFFFLSRRGDGWCQPVPSAHFSLETLGPFGFQPCLNQYSGFKRHFYSFTT